MKKVLLLLMVSFFLVSCTPQYVCPDGSIVSDPASCPREEQKIDEEVVAVPDPVEEFLSKRKSVESMSYEYKRIDKPLEKALTVWVKRAVVKRELLVQTNILNTNEMDVVIFNTADRTAHAYCESKKYCIKTGDAGAVDFDQHYIKTPLDWVEGIISAEKKGEARLGDRDVWILQMNGNVTMWVDTFFGVPLRVDKDQERHEFQNPAFNSVTDEDVQYREKEDRYT